MFVCFVLFCLFVCFLFCFVGGGGVFGGGLLFVCLFVCLLFVFCFVCFGFGFGGFFVLFCFVFSLFWIPAFVISLTLLLPSRPSDKTSASRAADLGSIPAFPEGFFPGGVI